MGLVNGVEYGLKKQPHLREAGGSPLLVDKNIYLIL